MATASIGNERKTKRKDGGPDGRQTTPRREKKLAREQEEHRGSNLKRRSEIHLLREAKGQKGKDSKTLKKWWRRRERKELEKGSGRRKAA